MYVLASRAVIWFAHSFSASQSSDPRSHLINATTAERVWTFFARLALYKTIHEKGLDGLRAPAVKKPETWRERRGSREGAAN